MKGSEIPAHWPLKRPINDREWKHVLKAMILRRIPTNTPIPEDELARFVNEDMKAAIPLLVTEKGFHGWLGEDYLKRKFVLLAQDGRLHLAKMGTDEEKDGRAVLGVYRTETTQRFLDELPLILRKVLDILPITNLTAWLAWEAVEPEELG